MRKIIPAVLEKDWKEIRRKIKIAEALSKRIQIDVADGKFVKNKTIGIKEIKKIKSKSKVEYHLMVRNPEKYINAIKKSEIIAIHCEIPDFEKFICKKVNAVAINPRTNAKKLTPVIKKIKKVIVMTVQPGWQGGKFRHSALRRIKEIKKMNKKIIVQVDGGINEKTIKPAEKAGADEFVVGSAIVKSENPKKMYELMRK